MGLAAEEDCERLQNWVMKKKSPAQTRITRPAGKHGNGSPSTSICTTTSIAVWQTRVSFPFCHTYHVLCLPPTEPPVCMPTPGCITGQSVSLTTFLSELNLEGDIIDGPPTNYNYNDYESAEGSCGALDHGSDGACVTPLVGEQSRSVTPDDSNPPMGRKERKKARSKQHRHDDRAKKQAQSGTGVKGVAAKRFDEAMRSTLSLNLDAQSDLPVTLPAWIATRAQGLPCRLFTKGELEHMNMIYFEWDGM
jgi:hypothetical protein